MFLVSQGTGATGSDASLSPDVRRKFVSKLARAFTRFEKGGKRFLAIGEQLRKIQQARTAMLLTRAEGWVTDKMLRALTDRGEWDQATSSQQPGRLNAS